MLCNITPQTRAKMRSTPNLLNMAVHNLGNEQNHILTAYATVGQYDMIAIAEAQDLDSVAQLSVEFSNMTEMSVNSVPALSVQNYESRWTAPVPAPVPQDALPGWHEQSTNSSPPVNWDNIVSDAFVAAPPQDLPY